VWPSTERCGLPNNVLSAPLDAWLQARTRSTGHLYNFWTRTVKSFVHPRGPLTGCVGPADATHAFHQPGRSAVALDHETIEGAVSRTSPCPSLRANSRMWNGIFRREGCLASCVLVLVASNRARGRSLEKIPTIVRETVGIRQPSGALSRQIGPSDSFLWPTSLRHSPSGVDQAPRRPRQGPFLAGRVRWR